MLALPGQKLFPLPLTIGLRSNENDFSRSRFYAFFLFLQPSDKMLTIRGLFRSVNESPRMPFTECARTLPPASLALARKGQKFPPVRVHTLGRWQCV